MVSMIEKYIQLYDPEAGKIPMPNYILTKSCVSSGMNISTKRGALPEASS
jgi:hypothetical protein